MATFLKVGPVPMYHLYRCKSAADVPVPHSLGHPALISGRRTVKHDPEKFNQFTTLFTIWIVVTMHLCRSNFLKYRKSINAKLP